MTPTSGPRPGAGAVREGARVRAPQLLPGPWFNTDAPLTLAGLRGRFVLLEFWASCCANCLHVVDELRPLETARAEVLTVIGVHSPKFPHEAQPDAVRAAIERAGIEHPVLSDPALRLWREYAVRAWPTLVLIDPEGYVVAQAAGEGHVAALAAVLDRLVVEHDARGTLRRAVSGGTPVRPAPPPGALCFPAKAILLPAQRTGRDHDSLLVSDAGHHQVVELALDGTTVLRRVGSGVRGEPFAEPNGLALLPAGIADYDVLVADTANHVLRGLRLADSEITATLDLPAMLAGARTVTGPVPAMLSPWDVSWWPAARRVVVAAAGVHLLLAVDLVFGRAEILAGTTVEGLRDGPALQGWLAQPSGLAAHGERLWFVDAETSSLRCLTLAGSLHTIVGEGLFDFGFVDGPPVHARFQHPLGVTALPDGSLVVLDTFNGAVRHVDPRTGITSTLARDLAEPSGAVVVGGALVVVESAAHRLVTVPSALAVDHDRRATRPAHPVIDVRAGDFELGVVFDLPPGRVLDEREGPAVRLEISADPPQLLVDGAGTSSELARTIELAASGAGVLQISAQAVTCDDPTSPHPACLLHRWDWQIPVRVSEAGETHLWLDLLPD